MHCSQCKNICKRGDGISMKSPEYDGDFIFVTCSEKCTQKTWKEIRKKAKQTNSLCLMICVYCKKPADNMKKCSKCRVMHYCSVDCQKADWKTHKLICKPAHV